MGDIISFSDVASDLGITTQGAYYAFMGLADRPELGKGLTLHEYTISYHFAWLSRADADIFKSRYTDWLNGDWKCIQ